MASTQRLCHTRLALVCGLCTVLCVPAAIASDAFDDPLEPVSLYAVTGGALTWLDGEDALDTDADLWTRVRALLPPVTLGRLVSEFHVFSDGAEETLAYVSQHEDDPQQWVFAVDYVDAIDSSAGEWVTTLTHEFAHLIALNTAQVDPVAQSCGAQYEIDEGCALPASWLQQWHDTFWPGALMAEHRRDVGDSEANPDALDAFYDKHADRFVNDYAASNPVEDFAESFAYFVFMDAVAEPRSEREAKINFFYQYPALLSARRHIRSQTDVRRAGIDAVAE